MADVDTNANVKAAQFLASQEAGNTAEGAASSSLPSASQTGTASQFFQIEAGLNSVGEKVSPSVRELRSSSAASNADWRFRMSLGPGAKDLYAGIMAPLNSTDGVIFPYTPQIQINYRANYNKTTLTHANHPAFFYQGSEVSDVQVNATFTAQSSEEASYLMAAIHFFKATTKMYYGQDDNKGMPPPLIFLNGFGNGQFDNVACVNTQFNYNLPDNVDYIRTATNASNTGNPFQIQNAISSVKGGFSQSLSRLVGAGVNRNVARLGGLASSFLGANNPFGGVSDRIGSILGGFTGSISPSQLGANYVPTKIELAITLIPIVSRAKQTNEFSLKDFAAGNLRGHW
jgi:hypothetical protein